LPGQYTAETHRKLRNYTIQEDILNESSLNYDKSLFFFASNPLRTMRLNHTLIGERKLMDSHEQTERLACIHRATFS
jgi:hypothetical protein